MKMYTDWCVQVHIYIYTHTRTHTHISCKLDNLTNVLLIFDFLPTASILVSGGGVMFVLSTRGCNSVAVKKMTTIVLPVYHQKLANFNLL